MNFCRHQWKLIPYLCSCLCSIKFLLWITKSSIIIINNDFISTDTFALVVRVHCTEMWILGFCLPKDLLNTWLIHLWCDILQKKIEIQKSFYFKAKHKYQRRKFSVSWTRACVNSWVLSFPSRDYSICHSHKKTGKFVNCCLI